jgi:hypothetical protein
LIRGGDRFASRKRVNQKEPRSDSIGTEKALSEPWFYRDGGCNSLNQNVSRNGRWRSPRL